MSKDLVRAPSRSLPESAALEHDIVWQRARDLADHVRWYGKALVGSETLIASGRWKPEPDAARCIVRLVLDDAGFAGVVAALEAMVAEKADYMRLNKLGDPAKEHTNKMAAAALAKAWNLRDGASCASTLGTDAEDGSPGMTQKAAPPPKFPQGREGE